VSGLPELMEKLAATERVGDAARVYEKACEKQPDLVNHPAHYNRCGIEADDVVEAWNLNYRLGNVVTYVLRAEFKGAALMDLKKARWFLDREIQRREKSER
jgi:hypothetical protein